MILEHLLKKSEFKRFVVSLKIPDHMTNLIAHIDWRNDNYLKDIVEHAIKLSPLCIENRYARIEKKKVAYKALSYLCRNNYSCDDVFNELYSRKNSESMQKASELKEKYKDEYVLRQQYIWALDEIYNQRQELNKLFENLELFAEYANYPTQTKGISKIKNAVNFLHDTDEYKNRRPTGNLDIPNIAIYLRNQYSSDLDKSLDDGAIIAYWLNSGYEFLSNANLKMLGNLLCDFYKEAYISEIEKHRKEKKKDYNRKRHTPKKRLSAQEKRTRINELKSKGYSQKETASILEVSKSSVERNWNK